MSKSEMVVDRKKWIQAQQSKGKTYLYYRRGGERVQLPGPEGSAAFLNAYLEIHTKHVGQQSSSAIHTIKAAIVWFMAPDRLEWLAFKPATQRYYKRLLETVRSNAGHLPMADIDDHWVYGLKKKIGGKPQVWNKTRQLMATIWQEYGVVNRIDLPKNPWRESRRIKEAESEQNRKWPVEIINAIFSEATPEFRGVLIACLLTSQRIGDVVNLRDNDYDPTTRKWRFQQGKTEKWMTLTVGDMLAESFEATRGRVSGYLLCTPRGVRWTKARAEETLLSIRDRLGLGQYTLHGLRSTGPSAARQNGVSLQVLMALTGHTTEKSLRVYLRGVDDEPFAAQAAEHLEAIFKPVLEAINVGANMNSTSGRTGKAAAAAGVVGNSIHNGRALRRVAREADEAAKARST